MSDRPDPAWVAIEAVFDAVLAAPPDERADLLVRRCPDPMMRAEVQSLLAAHCERGPLDELADIVMAPLFAPRPVARDPREALATHERYRVVERLGGGGMGVVYRARDERLGRDVALKFLPPHLSADLAAKKRFLVEARAAAAIEHPNICTVHEIGDTDDGQLYIVMACYDGEALDRHIARGPLPVADALRITTEVARGLAKAHERGIVHRDIKPANVMITADGHVKILDFGIAKLSGVTTQTVGAIGTVAYMSPEQAFGEAVDHRTDYWSLGVLLYEMLTGIRPFTGPQHAMLMAVLTAEPEPITARRSDVPPGVERLVRTLLAKRPEERFPDAARLLAALADAPTVRSAAPAVTDVVDTALTAGGERRQVTIVHGTLLGVDTLYEQQAPDVADRVLARLRDLAEAVATEHGGLVNHFSNDGFAMLFGVPTSHEDDPVRAVRAALALSARLDVLPAPAGQMALPLGLHTGAVVAQRLRQGDRRFRITGAAADLSARLSAAASHGTILISSETRRLAAPFVIAEPSAALALVGGASTVPYRVVGLAEIRPRFEGAAAASPFLGRDRERDLLQAQLETARHGQGHVSVVIGEAGAGKSRLVHELRRHAVGDGVSVLLGRCDAYGTTTSFLPFIEAALGALGIEAGLAPAERQDDVVRAVRAQATTLDEYLPLYLTLLAVPSAQYPVPEHLRDESLQLAMRDALAALFVTAAARPTLLVLEDWHWADEASRATLRQLAEIAPNVPLLVLVTSRPDGASELTAAEHLSLLSMPPLDASASAGIARAVFGADQVAAPLVAYLHERTGGNPFFLEEVCEALREEGTVVVRDGHASAVGTSEGPRVPETVQGVLRTRIDRLDPVARDTLRVAAVIGREFARGVLEPVAKAGAELPRAIDRLKASGLVQQSALVPVPMYRFKHALTQEVAYDSLLEHQRRTLHEAVGRAIEARYSERIDEQVERLAHHFSRAECWPDAVRYGIASADRAQALSQNLEALGTLERTDEWLGKLPEGSARLGLEADVRLRQERLCEVMGLRTRQLAIVAALIDRLAPHGPSANLAQAYLRQGDAFTLLKRFDDAEAALTSARRVAAGYGDEAAQRSALRSLALLRSHQIRYEEALAQIEQVIALARDASDSRAEAGDLASMANILRAMGQHERALAVLETAMAQARLDTATSGSRSVHYGALLNVIGTVHKELGNLEAADDYYRRTRGQLPDHAYASFSLPLIAQMQLERGDVEAALTSYLEALAMNRRARYTEGTAQLSRSVGEVLAGLGRQAEAIPYLAEAAQLFRQLDDPGSELEVVEGMARALRRTEATAPGARKAYEAALQLAERLGDANRQLTLLNTLGILAWEHDALDEAVSHFTAGLRLCEHVGDAVHQGLMLNSLGATFLRQQRYEEAGLLLERSLRVTDAQREHRLHLHALLTLARVHVARRDRTAAQDAVGRAEEYADALHDAPAQAALARLRAELEVPFTP